MRRDTFKNSAARIRTIKTGIWIEANAWGIKPASCEAISAALAGGMEESCQAIAAAGEPHSLCREVGAQGIAELAYLQVPEPDRSPDRLAAALAWHIRSAGISDLVAGGTASGRDIISRVAAILGSPLLQDCVRLDLPARRASKYILSGQVLGHYDMPGPINLYGLRPNSWKGGRGTSGNSAKLTFVNPHLESARVRVVESIVLANTPDLLEARVVVAGGRSIGSVDNFNLLRDCAKALGGAIGASRSAVDSGYAPPSIQIGQTGSVVSPDLYIACGISGSVHHMAGVKTARTIVSINKDRTAPIFSKSDFGLVGDLFEVLPLLKQFIKSE